MVSWADARLGRAGGLTAQEGYRTAAVCQLGHVATSDVEIDPGLPGKYCKECGEPILQACPACQSRIRGYYHVSGVISARRYVPPNYCEDCGKAFPWMVRKLQAASALESVLKIGEEVASEAWS